MTIGQQALRTHGLNFEGYIYWLSLGALFGFAILFNLGFTLTLTYLKSPGKSRSIISHQQISSRKDERHRTIRKQLDNKSTLTPENPAEKNWENGLAFHAFDNFIPRREMKEQGSTQKKLQLLCDITGAFRPGILTALMGVSGAGKTTLMDVLSRRKTGGYIEGDIRNGWYPKVQDTFARISGYCKQTDVHSPNVTVKESVIYLAWLRLSSEMDTST